MAEFIHFKGWGQVMTESPGTRGSELKTRDGSQRMSCLICDSGRGAGIGNDNT